MAASSNAPAQMDERQCPFQPFGASLEVMYSAHPEILFDGPRNTSKTMTALNKLILLAHAWEGSHMLIARKTLRSMRNRTLKTLEEKVLPAGHPALRKFNRHSAEPMYQIGTSLISTCGFDDEDKIRGGDYDIALIDEAKDITDDDLSVLVGCMRNGKGAYHQILLCTNPAGPRHHLIVRAHDPNSRMIRIPSRHQDNPTLYDHERDEWTDWGKEYMGGLQELTGHRYWRDYKGLWRSSEGVAVPEWDEDIHVIDRFTIPKDWPRVVTIDFGYVHPMVVQWWALDEDRRAFRYREIYHTKRLVEDHAKQARRLTEAAGEQIQDTIADHDAEGRATWERYWMTTIRARKDREAGMSAVKARLRPAGDGRPRLFYLRDSLVERDVALACRARPTCTEEEWDGLVWQKNAKGDEKEDIVKQDDDGYDATRYLCMYLDGAEDDYLVDWI